MKHVFGLFVSALLVLSVSGAEAVELAGRGSIGGSAGMMRFLSGEQLGESPKPRFMLQASFKYNVTDAWSAVVETGWGWNAYDSGTEGVDDTLATVIPTTIGVQYRMNLEESILHPNVGAGIGLYSLGVKDTFNSWAYANQGTQKLTWTKPGMYLRGGVEWIFSNGAAVNMDLAWHMILSNDDRFDRWGNQNTSFAQFRVGASYYFALTGGGGDASPDDE
mgnify:CR=1 FL=1